MQGNRVACDHEGCDYSLRIRALGPARSKRHEAAPDFDPRREFVARKAGPSFADDGDVCPGHAESDPPKMPRVHHLTLEQAQHTLQTENRPFRIQRGAVKGGSRG